MSLRRIWGCPPWATTFDWLLLSLKIKGRNASVLEKLDKAKKRSFLESLEKITALQTT